jgi:hypothetical protein
LALGQAGFRLGRACLGSAAGRLAERAGPHDHPLAVATEHDRVTGTGRAGLAGGVELLYVFRRLAHQLLQLALGALWPVARSTGSTGES